MKTPFTEKFLWDLYSITEAFGEFAQMGKISLRKYMESEMYRLQHDCQKQRGRKAFSKLISHLKIKGYIQIPELESKKGFILTLKGREKILKIKHKFIKRKRRQDGKWEMVIFDIPEKEKRKRDIFRVGLERLGYQQLQKSIWISPYDVLKETQELIKTNNLIDHVRLLLIEEIYKTHSSMFLRDR